MKPWHLDDQATIYHGDCLEVLRELPDASVDSVVTDPPYGLEFMGKEWDAFAPRDRKNAMVWDGRRQAQSGWTEAAAERSGKGGGGPSYRSTHKGAKRCRLCGKRAFSGSPCICDQPEWVIEHRQEAPAAMLGFQAFSEAWAREAYRVLKPGGHLLAFGGTRTWHRLAVAIEDAGFEIRDSIAWMYGSGFPKSLDVSKAIDKAAGAERATKRVPYSTNVMQQGIGVERPWMKAAAQAGFHEVASDAPATPDAARWQGWGTALKPAHEPVVVARKPLTGTVAANVLEHGTGALNIDGCRIGTDEIRSSGQGIKSGANNYIGGGKDVQPPSMHTGRWPANVVLDEDQAAALDKQSGNLTTNPGTARSVHTPGMYGPQTQPGRVLSRGDSGGASRFFYVAKAPARERPKVDGVAHPTVKPLTLMRWLCRLVTPPGGVVLEPFAGSGTTIEAALMEGFQVVAIEREPDYLPLIAARLERVAQEPDDGQLTFDASA